MRLPALILLGAATLFGQVDGLVTNVSRTVNLTPDEADFIVVVATTLDTTQNQVVEVFHDAGVQNLTITAVAAGLNNSIYPPAADSQLFYQIGFTTAPAAMTAFARKLDAMRAAPPAGIVSLQFSAGLNASQSAIDAAHLATLGQLLIDARAKAQVLATTAGLKLGAITGITESNYGASNNNSAWFAVTSAYFIASNNQPITTQYTFYATVKFAAQ